MVINLISCGIDVEAQHHEVASGGQCEIDLRFQPLLKPLTSFYYLNILLRIRQKKIIRQLLICPNRSSVIMEAVCMFIQAYGKKENLLFAGSGYAGLSEMALYFIGGILKHAPSLLAFTNPTTNSYKRLVPGFEAPVNLAYSQRNRSASVRIPMYSTSPKAKRIEFRCPDPSCNPYLAFSAMLMAGLDGIINRIDPGDPLDKDIYDMPPEELANVPSTPGSFNEALKALQNDHEYLLKGDVFTEDVIETWIKYKIDKEIKPMALTAASL